MLARALVEKVADAKRIVSLGDSGNGYFGEKIRASWVFLSASARCSTLLDRAFSSTSAGRHAP